MASLLDENRKFLRFPVSIPVNLDDRSENLSTICSNLSQKGAYIETSEKLKIGDVLCFNLSLSSKETPVKLLGEVKWVVRTEVKDYSNKKVKGFGIKFLANMKNNLDLNEGILEKERWKPNTEKDGLDLSSQLIV